LEYIKCERLDATDLWRIADEARVEYWPENTFPIDMEKILEIKLQLNIDFIHELKSNFDIIAFLKNDMSGIFIDHTYYMKDNLSNPLRFALAHEMGHYILHRDIYSKITFNSPQDWQDFTISMPESEYSAFECQANEFAGRFLVPRDILKQHIKEAARTIESANLKEFLKRNPYMVLPRVTPPMRRYFGVSDEVIEKRVQREKLWPPRL